MKRLILLFVLVITQFSLFSQQPAFVIDANSNRKTLGNVSEYLEDKDGTLTLEEVEKLDFEANDGSSLNFGFTNSTYWMRLKIKNKSEFTD